MIGIEQRKTGYPVRFLPQQFHRNNTAHRKPGHGEPVERAGIEHLPPDLGHRIGFVNRGNVNIRYG